MRTLSRAIFCGYVALALHASATHAQAPIPLPAPTPQAPSAEDPNRELLRAKLAERDRLSAEIEALRAATQSPQQLLVSIEVLEVSLTKMRQLGLKVPAIDAPGLKAEDFQPAPYSPPEQTSAVTPAGAFTPADQYSLADLIAVLKKNNVAKTLADPQVVVNDGRSASLHVGGQMPLPALPGDDRTIEFLDLGTNVDILAKSLGNREVMVRLQLKLTELDTRPEFVLDQHGRRVPAVDGMSCETSSSTTLGQPVIITSTVSHRVEAVANLLGRDTERHIDVAQWTILRVDAVDE